MNFHEELKLVNLFQYHPGIGALTFFISLLLLQFLLLKRYVNM